MDGYKCITKCFDLPQDLTYEETARTANVFPYNPKEAKCPRGTYCGKRTGPPPVTTTDKNNCDQVGEGFECLDIDECDPNSIVQKQSSNIDKLFQTKNLIEGNLFGEITVNPEKSPCQNPTHICCKKGTSKEN